MLSQTSPRLRGVTLSHYIHTYSHLFTPIHTIFVHIHTPQVEEIRRMLSETSPWLLGVTAAVSLLHSVFDFLAFKNDVQFWRNNKSSAAG